MKLLLNFADEKYRDAQQLNTQTGREVAGFDHVISRSPTDLPAEFAKRHRRILWQKRGAGYWLWKPFFVIQALEELGPDDYLFYCDAGSYFIDSIEPLIDVSRESRQNVLTFALAHPEKHWTKRDAFLLLNCDSPAYADTPQRMAGFVLLRKSTEALELARAWLEAAQDERALTDLANQLGQPNYEGFVEHRHDSSLLSLLSKQRGMPAFRDPSQYGNTLRDEYPNSPYNQLIELTRMKSPIPLWPRIVRETRRLANSVAALWPAA